MPVTPTYPGVYIEEIPSGVRTITGVATSITAFLGRALEGPPDEPVTIYSFGDFQRRFGGLEADLPMGYAVQDFFQNGGAQAIVVRLYKPPAQNKDGKGRLSVGDLDLVAVNPGEWGNLLAAKIAHPDEKVVQEIAARHGLEAKDLFNLTIVRGFPNGPQETFYNVAMDPDSGPLRVDRVLQQGSRWARVETDFDDSPAVPDETDAKADPTNPKNKPDDVAAVQFTGGDDGKVLDVDKPADWGSEDEKTGLYALEKADLFNLLCIPPDQRGDDTPAEVYGNALDYCVKRRAMLIVDPPKDWAKEDGGVLADPAGALEELGLQRADARNAAVYFPRVKQADPQREGQEDVFVPCGIIAGVMARTDAQRGVWKAPAGIDATLSGIRGLKVTLTDEEDMRLTDADNGTLNPLGINCLRTFPIYGHVVWGARTLRGADQIADDYKYIPVRRMALFLEESLYRGTKWVVFEPNDEPLWSQIRLNIGAFLHSLFRQGAFAGQTPRDAYFVKCDKDTTTQDDVNRGIVNILVGFAPLKPAEFVIIKIQQISRPIAT